MRLIVFCIFLAINGFNEVAAQNTANQGVLKSEQKRFGFMVLKDTLHLRDLLADDLLYIHSNGIRETKREHLLSLASGKIEYKSMERESGVVVRRHGKTAITNGRVHVTGTINGTAFDIMLLYTAAYRKHKKEWRLWSWQSTKLN